MLLAAFSELSQMYQCAIIGITAGLFTLWWTRPFPRLPPGPRGLPLLGSLLDLKDDTVETLYDWGRYFGPYMTVYKGRVATMYLNTREAVDETFVKQQSAFTARPQPHSVAAMTCGQKGIQFSDYTPTLKHQRKVMSMALRSYTFLSGFHLEDKIHQSVSKVIELLKTEKTAVDPLPYLALIDANIMCGVCFDKTHDVGSNDFRKFMALLDDYSKLTESFFWEDIVPPLKWLPTPRFNNMLTTVKRLKKYIEKRVEIHKETFNPENIRDVLDAILLSQLEDEEEEVEVSQRLTDDHVVHTILDMFNAGNDPVRLTLSWTLLYLAVHQDIQEKVHQELDEVLESRCMANVVDRPYLSYLQAVIYESMRLSTVVPFGLPHRAIKDAKIGPYDVPKNSNVLINHWAIHHDPDHWEDPATFKPERFLTEEGKVKTTITHFLPFSVGRRACLGEYLAKPELHLILAGLLKNFHISPEDGVEPSLEPNFKAEKNRPRDYKLIFKVRS
ncbi:cytochrome P450 1A5-like [Haliotis rubra]|uniref:cytochrome P450 1A5-like n=1 Tax=Haliotis rubra TaxID=36100 RepID=UPI001EE50C86|nr:cytochrome P450 1A5-like [Haliotis rubra]